MQVQWQTSVPHAAHRIHAISAFFWSHTCAHLELHMRNPFRENWRFSPALAARAHAADSRALATESAESRAAAQKKHDIDSGRASTSHASELHRRASPQTVLLADLPLL